jgi:hypothetical protein
MGANRVRAAGALLVAALAAGCSSSDVAIVIKSDPAGATVYIDGERAGEDGGTFALHFGSDPRRKVHVQLCLRGREPAEAMWELVEVPSPDGRGVREKTFRLERVR